MKKSTIILISSAVLLALSAFNVISAEEPNQAQAENEKSVAWYVANIREAKAKNQQCFDSRTQQSTPECENALHALQISFNGGN
ncbi:hypothetical protein [Methylomonas sp. MgM2]